jgi:hypothetical protein
MPHGNLKSIATRIVGAEDGAASATSASVGGATVVARRLGIGMLALHTYMRTHGGVPDGLGHARPTASERHDGIAPPPGLVQRALPSSCARTPWVKRDRPRYFMPG